MAKIISSVMQRFNYLISEIDNAYHEASYKLGIADTEMMILYILTNNDGESLLSEVSRISGVSKQTINSAVRKLEKAELLELVNVDGRTKKICLTDKGYDKARATAGKIIEIENDVFSQWSEAERKEFIILMERFLTSFKDGIKEI